jgi:DNA polymerase-3 subunit epsilon
MSDFNATMEEALAALGQVRGADGAASSAGAESAELDRPFVSFDLETTSADPETARIVQIATVRYPRRGIRLFKAWLLDPQAPIEPEASEVHGYTDASVKGKPAFADVAGEVREVFRDADIAGYNILAFDLPILLREFEQCGAELDLDDARILDSYLLYKHFEPHTLSKAVEFYCGHGLEGAHDAGADAKGAAEVLVAQLSRHGIDADEAARLSWGDRVTLDGRVVWGESGEACLSFGKHAKAPLTLVPKSYLRWLLRQSWLPAKTARVVDRAYRGEQIMRPGACKDET